MVVANTRWRGRSARVRASSACSSRPAMRARRSTPRTSTSRRPTCRGCVEFARQNEIDLTVVGPEAALGRRPGRCVSATPACGRSARRRRPPSSKRSKVFCKNLLRHADVPTADYRVFRDAKAAITYLKDRDDVPVVVKADGLAAGKGVIVCDNREQALEAVDRIAVQKEFGEAGNQLVIEERLHGQEASVLALTDGHTLLTHARLPGSQAGLRRRHRPEHRRHGRLLPDAAGHRPDAATRSRKKSSCRRSTR